MCHPAQHGIEETARGATRRLQNEVSMRQGVAAAQQDMRAEETADSGARITCTHAASRVWDRQINRGLFLITSSFPEKVKA